ncbi:MAG TPA: DNA starvation/stationary phase protection protein [Cytophagaceae bacterium]|jgi:starvation-inducible DNA-binding protein|nr:DNA starvation/stationary phase protection protein [Cytophagaceae bacterium]
MITKPDIGISEKNLEGIADLLGTVLSDAMVLYTKTRKFHWNVSGESFMELHKLFQAQYTELEEAIDEIAERINKLGIKTIGTMQEFVEHARLKESPGKYPDQKGMIKELLHDHEAIVNALRKDIDVCADQFHDVGTTDFLTKLIQQHETNAWVLRRYLG